MNAEKILEMMLENPDTIPALVPALVEKYKPALYSICNELHNMLKDYSNNTEYFETNAKIKKQIFDAYVNAGFSEEQAIVFMINDNIKLMNSIKNTTRNINSKK